jgi:hypothetical protein
MGIGTWIGENRGAIAFTAVVMLLGTAGYFVLGIREGMAPAPAAMPNPIVTSSAGSGGEMAPGIANATVQGMNKIPSGRVDDGARSL